MKINLDHELPMGNSHNYKKDKALDAPPIIQAILQIEGIKGVYHVADFLAIERNAKYDWQELLLSVRQAFGEEGIDATKVETVDEHFGEIKVEIQFFKDIPLQVKLSDGLTERRFGMPDYFLRAREKAQLPKDNYILLRKWQNQGARYGDFDQIGHEVVEELIAAYSVERLEELITKSQESKSSSLKRPIRVRKTITLDDLENSDWRVRYQILEQMDDPGLTELHVLEKALKDELPSIRRLGNCLPRHDKGEGSTAAFIYGSER